jgi:hypothetical protein
MHLSGVAVRTDQVQLLVGLLTGDELAAKLKLAITNRNDLVALSASDRERIVDVLPDPPPSGLAELRSVLVQQLKQARAREASESRSREAQRMREGRELRKQRADEPLS